MLLLSRTGLDDTSSVCVHMCFTFRITFRTNILPPVVEAVPTGNWLPIDLFSVVKNVCREPIVGLRRDKQGYLSEKEEEKSWCLH